MGCSIWQVYVHVLGVESIDLCAWTLLVAGADDTNEVHEKELVARESHIKYNVGVEPVVKLRLPNFPLQSASSFSTSAARASRP